jgi:hypothetical protein
LICSMLIKRHSEYLAYDPLGEDSWREGAGGFGQSASASPETHRRDLHRLTHSASSPKPFIAGSLLARGQEASPSPVSRPLSRGTGTPMHGYHTDAERMRPASAGQRHRPPPTELSHSDYESSTLLIDTHADDGFQTFPHSTDPSQHGTRRFARTHSPPRTPETLPFIAGSYTQMKAREKNTLFTIYSPPAPLREKSPLFPFSPYQAPHKTPTKRSKVRVTPANTTTRNDPHTPTSAEKKAADTLRLQWVPFQPSVCRFLDVIISVEQCVDCHLHNWSSWHVAENYTKSAGDTMHTVLLAIAKHYPRLRVFAFKVKNQCNYKASQRVGALEVTVTIKTSADDNTKWSSKTIHSKLATLR